MRSLLSSSLLALLCCISCGEESLVEIPTTDLTLDDSSELVESVEVQIYSQVSNSTRLDGTTWGTGDQIGIYMSYYNIYTELESNVQYETKLGDGYFTPYDDDDKLYYPNNTSTVDIFAYYPYKTTTLSNTNMILDISSPYQQDQESLDLLRSYISGIKFEERETPVVFEFEHRLSRIDLVVYPGDGYDISDLEAMSINISDQSTKAIYSLHDDTLYSYNGSDDDGEITLYSSVDTDKDYVAASAILFPHTTSSDCTLTFELVGGESFEYAIPSLEFLEGWGRLYTLSVNKRGVEFISANIVSWGDVEVHDGVEAEYMVICDEEDLVEFRDLINSGGSQSAILASNITLTESSWTPIGSDTYPFVASFNGAGFSISALSIDNASGSFQALFGVVGDGITQAYISDLTIESPSVVAGSGCAAIAGKSNYAMFESCSVSGGIVSGVEHVGSIVGIAISTTLKYCTSSSCLSEGGDANALVGTLRDGSIIID